MKAPQFGTDGVRGVANKELTPEVALALARASAIVLGGNKPASFVIGRDTRHSGPTLEAAFVAGATAAGADVELLGVVPTPAVAWAAADRSCLGAMISASHNPFEDNGIKLFGPGGKKLTDAQEEAVQDKYLGFLEAAMVSGPTGRNLGAVKDRPVSGEWLASLVNSVKGQTLDGLKIVVDAANGAAVDFGPEVFRQLGASVEVLAVEPDGMNINDKCGSTSPQALQLAVIEHGADVGIAFDGDADRLLAVDELGQLVDGDHMLAILAQDYKGRDVLAGNTVVVTVMTNLGFHLAMKDTSIDVVTTDVGDRYVLEALDAGGFSLGGEQSGHIICRDLATTGDGILSGVQLLDVVQRSKMPLSKLASGAMSTVPQILRNVEVLRSDVNLDHGLAPLVAEIEEDFGERGRILVRRSGTQPLLRVMVEHVETSKAEEACTRLVESAQQLMK